MASNAEVLRDLARAKVAFQLRAIETVLTASDAPHCRWCDELVIRGLPCTCARAQEEARRVMGGAHG